MLTRTTLGATILGLALVLTTALMSGAVPPTRMAGLGGHEGARWRHHLAVMDEAVDRTDIPAARRAWQAAHGAGLGSRRWEASIETADAHLRLARVAGVPGVPRARELYLVALLRAREAGSRDGVLRAARAFEALGDREVASQARRIAEGLRPAG